MKKRNKFFILGDSFCYGGHIHKEREYFFANDLRKEFKDTHEVIVDAYPSRDVQTIIDNWIKLIPHLTKDDILVVAIPFFTRIRVPLAAKDYMMTEWSDGELETRFVTHHSWYHAENQSLYINGIDVSKEELDKKIEFLEQMYFEHDGVEKNYNEVIKSLYDITNCSKYLFSWDNMKNQIPEIEYKDEITKKIGSWTTIRDVYLETNGEYGIEHDFHWDYRFHPKFSKYLTEKFKK